MLSRTLTSQQRIMTRLMLRQLELGGSGQRPMMRKKTQGAPRAESRRALMRFISYGALPPQAGKPDADGPNHAIHGISGT